MCLVSATGFTSRKPGTKTTPECTFFVQPLATPSSYHFISFLGSSSGRYREHSSLRQHRRLELAYIPEILNSCDAIDWYEEHWRHVELVFLDMCSPILNGEDGFPVLRSINPTVQIVLISGRVDFAIVNELMAQGALCFVRKPFHFPRMAGWVLHRLGRSVPDKVLREDAFS